MDEAETRPPSFGRILLLLPVAVALILFFALHLNRYVSLAALAEHREWLVGEVARLGVLAGLAFVLLYAVLVAASIPAASLLTITGGFLFGAALGGALAVTGATLGATAIFLLARTALAEILRARAGPAIQRLEAGFRRNALFYLLFLRLVPAAPFVVVNLVPAFLGVDLATYVIGTALGIMPGGLIYAAIGSGLGALFEQGAVTDLHHLAAKPAIWGPLLALALLSLLPVAVKAWLAARRRGKTRLPGTAE
jgi:uncharacterized membrane protein YdjX (TVP38/TMEM64 family)